MATEEYVVTPEKERYQSEAVANYFLKRGRAYGETMNPQKLQKLVYYAHGYHLAMREEALIDESVTARRFGVAIQSLFDWAAKRFGRRPVEGLFELNSESASRARIDEELSGFLCDVWGAYGGFTGRKLSKMTHMPGTPWHAIKKKHQGYIPRGKTIPDEEIKAYFEKLIAESNESLGTS